jgi:hypothetical protein
MWSTTILLHRPFIQNWQSSSSNAATSTLQDPQEICLFAANKICSVIEMYTRYMCGLPSDLIFPIFVAGNILQSHWRRMENKDIAVRKQLELCIKWLNGLGKSWKNAEQRQQMLVECKMFLPKISKFCTDECTKQSIQHPRMLMQRQRIPQYLCPSQ